MDPTDLDSIFEKIRALRIGVIGDFAVDFYFDLEKATSEISLETGKEVWWGSLPRTSLGGAGNVVQNIVALGVGTVKIFGAVGSDIYGREMLHLMQKLRVDTAALHVQQADWDTCVYAKPMQNGGELNRLDFGTNNALSEEAFEEMLRSLRSQMSLLDVLIINQQFPRPLITERRVELLNALVANYPQVFVVADMRTHGLALRGVTLKVNTEELARLLKVEGYENWTSSECVEYGKQLVHIIEGPVLITRGAEGMLYVSENKIQENPAQLLDDEIDTVGAGDTAVAAFAASAGAKVPIEKSLKLANLAAAVTVQKLNQTGTATQQEIMELAKSPMCAKS